MKMPDRIENSMFAPCGMNCLVCYKYCHSKKPCPGCQNGEEGKPEHCRVCAIKSCVREKELDACYVCGNFPCTRIKRLEKSYQTRYRASLVENSQFVKKNGISAFMEEQKSRYICDVCGGVISLHDHECSECKLPLKRDRKGR